MMGDALIVAEMIYNIILHSTNGSNAIDIQGFLIFQTNPQKLTALI